MLIDVTTDIKDYFGDLASGDTFYYPPSRCVWMRLNLESVEHTKCNAVSLDDGTLEEFYDYEEVVKIKTKLVNA